MILHESFGYWDFLGAWNPQAPASVSCRTTTIGGALVEVCPVLGVGADRTINTTDALYVQLTAYYVEWTFDMGGGNQIAVHKFTHYAVGVDLTPPGAATIRVLSDYADTTSLTVAFTKPSPDTHYDHAIIEAVSMTGGTPIQVTATASGNYTLTGLSPATALIVTGLPLSSVGVAGPLAFALASTHPETKPANWTQVSVYANDEASVHERGPFFFSTDDESGKLAAWDALGVARIFRIRITCPNPARHLRLDSLGFHTDSQGPVAGAPASSY